MGARRTRRSRRRALSRNERVKNRPAALFYALGGHFRRLRDGAIPRIDDGHDFPGHPDRRGLLAIDAEFVLASQSDPEALAPGGRTAMAR
ncbi:MAG: hypothetical protein MZV63_33940 [Marinilabiliales bacterium]|nr:hypothetical protein [Marinilabiliales bacterium]